VANPKYINDIEAFISKIKSLCACKKCQSLDFIKNAFGVGWSGIPDSWDKILKKVLSLGFKSYDLWEIYWSEGNLPVLTGLPPITLDYEYETPKTFVINIKHEK
jgi:hypothetical protein